MTTPHAHPTPRPPLPPGAQRSCYALTADQLILALYRCGRQADALAAYQRARRVLVEQLGIEPSAPLRTLQQAILRQEPSLELA